ncbi:hypothetical protein CSPAE12_09158, partial [Colletotrichum incanum]
EIPRVKAILVGFDCRQIGRLFERAGRYNRCNLNNGTHVICAPYAAVSATRRPYQLRSFVFIDVPRKDHDSGKSAEIDEFTLILNNLFLHGPRPLNRLYEH